jgi:proline iminopeptidase
MSYAKSFAARVLLALGVAAPATLMAQRITHPTGAYVSVAGHRIWYESEGQGEPLLLIPGGPGAGHGYFHPYFSALRTRARVIYFDPFGIGKSDRAKNPAEYTLDGEVADIEALRAALHLGPINLLGHSYGGIVAETYAVKYPQSVKRLILSNTLVSTAAWQTTNDHANAEVKLFFPESVDKMAELKAKGVSAMAPEMMAANPDPNQVMAHLFFYDRSNIAKLNMDNASFNADVMTAIGGADMDNTIGGDLAHIDFHGKLESLPFPILILAGRADGVVLPRLARELQAAAPQAQFVMFEHSGHYPFIEEHGKVVRTIAAFLHRSAVAAASGN